MPYVPNNPAVYVAAASGCLTGIGADGKLPADSGPSSFYMQMARAFAQEFDAQWGAGPVTDFERMSIYHACGCMWQGRSTLPSDRALLPGSYAGIVRTVIALIQEGNAQIVAEGVDPNAGAAGGGGVGIIRTMFNFATSTVLLDSFVPGTTVIKVSCLISTPFDAPSIIRVGTPIDLGLMFDTGDIVATAPNVYTNDELFEFDTSTDLLLTVTPNGATMGAGLLICLFS